jgi:hypothetical protein
LQSPKQLGEITKDPQALHLGPLHLGRNIVLTDGARLDSITGSRVDRVGSTLATCYNMLSICIVERWNAKTLVLLGI